MRSRSNSSLLRGAIRYPDVFVASVRHHSRRVISRPIRTILWMLFTFAFVVLLAALGTNPNEMQALVESGLSVSGVVAIVPPPLFLLVIAVATILSVTFGTVIRGVRRDLGSNRRRQRRRNS